MPKEYNSLLSFFKFIGLDIELEKEILNNLILEDILNKNPKSLIERRKALIKLIYPDHKDEQESIMQEAQQKIMTGDKIIKMGVKKDEKLTPEQVNKMLGN